MTEQISGGEAILLAMKSNGINQVFGLPGAQIYPFFDALQRHDVETYVTRHEQGAAYMALGAAKSTGKPSAYSVVPGPGVLNTTAALCTAMGTCSQVLCVTGQIPSTFMGIGRGHLHELADQVGTLSTLVKSALHIADPTETGALVNEAFRIMGTGRPGPVAVEMCWDTMAAQCDIDIELETYLIEKPELDIEQIKAAAKTIAASKKPMIMCGAGAQDAAENVQRLAELLCCPVTAFRSGRGVVAEDDPLGISSVAARLLWDDCDLLIGIGSRLEMQYLRWPGWDGYKEYKDRPEDDRKLIRIDIDPLEMERFKPDIPVVGDSSDACNALLSELELLVSPNKIRLKEIAEAKNKSLQLIRRIQPQVSYWEVIRKVLPRSGFIVPEVSQMGFTSYFAVPIFEPRTYVTEGFQGNLGFGFQTALGVKVANPDKAVVAVVGDGSFMFGVQELSTAVKYNIGVVTLVFNNNAFGNVLRDQKQIYNNRLIGCELVNPDFVKLAESFGMKGFRVTTPAELKPVLEKAIDSNQPVLIEIYTETGSETSPWEFIAMKDYPT